MINRDGANISLWQDNIDPFRSSTIASPDTIYDLIVVGGGITGLSTALLLQQSGLHCLLLEAANLGFGTTGGTTAHLNTLLDTPYSKISKNFNDAKARQVAQIARDAIELIRCNINEQKIDCAFEDADGFLFAKDEKQEKELDEILDASLKAGIDIEYTQRIPVPFTFRKAVRIKGQAKFSPLPYVQGLARAFEKAGGVIVQDCRVVDTKHGEIIEVSASTGDRYKGRKLFFATHIPPGVNLLHLRCVPYRSYAMAITLAVDSYPEGLSYDMEDPYHYYRTQRVNGRNYLIAGGEDHKTGHGDNLENHFRELESHVRKHFNAGTVKYQWSSQYFEPADGLPYIGHLPGMADNIYVATGFGGNGMIYGTASALLMKDILIDEDKTYDDPFSPNRVKPIAGFKNFISHNADVIKEFAGKCFGHDEIQELSDLAAGEARVILFENKKLAVYKSEDGMIYALNPICTHLKCEVNWNDAEKTWDCPCHGARYRYDGVVMTGPASEGLERIEIKELIEK